MEIKGATTQDRNQIKSWYDPHICWLIEENLLCQTNEIYPVPAKKSIESDLSWMSNFSEWWKSILQFVSISYFDP